MDLIFPGTYSESNSYVELSDWVVVNVANSRPPYSFSSADDDEGESESLGSGGRRLTSGIKMSLIVLVEIPSLEDEVPPSDDWVLEILSREIAAAGDVPDSVLGPPVPRVGAIVTEESWERMNAEERKILADKALADKLRAAESRRQFQMIIAAGVGGALLVTLVACMCIRRAKKDESPEDIVDDVAMHHKHHHGHADHSGHSLSTTEERERRRLSHKGSAVVDHIDLPPSLPQLAALDMPGQSLYEDTDEDTDTRVAHATQVAVVKGRRYSSSEEVTRHAGESPLTAARRHESIAVAKARRAGLGGGTTALLVETYGTALLVEAALVRSNWSRCAPVYFWETWNRWNLGLGKPRVVRND